MKRFILSLAVAVSTAFMVGAQATTKVGGSATTKVGGTGTTKVAGVSSSFVPTDIPGAKLWLVGDNVVSSPVATWPDYSGLSNDATQATGAKQPTKVAAALNGHAVVRFDGSNDTLSGTHGAINSVTVVFVAKIGASDAVYSNSQASTSVGSVLITNFSATNFSPIDSGVAVDSSYHVIAYGGDAAGQLITVDGVPTSNANFSGFFLTTYFIGSDNDGSQYMTGDVADIVVYDSTLSSVDRKKVEAYYGTRYGISITP